MLRHIYTQVAPATDHVVIENDDGKRYKVFSRVISEASSLFLSDMSQVPTDPGLIERSTVVDARSLNGIREVIRGDATNTYLAEIDDADAIVPLTAVELKTLIEAK